MTRQGYHLISRGRRIHPYASRSNSSASSQRFPGSGNRLGHNWRHDRRSPLVYNANDRDAMVRAARSLQEYYRRRNPHIYTPSTNRSGSTTGQVSSARYRSASVARRFGNAINSASKYFKDSPYKSSSNAFRKLFGNKTTTKNKYSLVTNTVDLVKRRSRWQGDLGVLGGRKGKRGGKRGRVGVRKRRRVL